MDASGEGGTWQLPEALTDHVLGVGALQAGAGDLCALCGERLYVLERLCADGRFFHRSCFRCHTCEATLWPGSYGQHPGDSKWVGDLQDMKEGENVLASRQHFSSPELRDFHVPWGAFRWSPAYPTVPEKPWNVWALGCPYMIPLHPLHLPQNISTASSTCPSQTTKRTSEMGPRRIR